MGDDKRHQYQCQAMIVNAQWPPYWYNCTWYNIPGTITPGTITPGTTTPGKTTSGATTPGTNTPGTITSSTITPCKITPSVSYLLKLSVCSDVWSSVTAVSSSASWPHWMNTWLIFSTWILHDSNSQCGNWQKPTLSSQELCGTGPWQSAWRSGIVSCSYVSVSWQAWVCAWGWPPAGPGAPPLPCQPPRSPSWHWLTWDWGTWQGPAHCLAGILAAWWPIDRRQMLQQSDLAIAIGFNLNSCHSLGLSATLAQNLRTS